MNLRVHFDIDARCSTCTTYGAFRTSYGNFCYDCYHPPKTVQVIDPFKDEQIRFPEDVDRLQRLFLGHGYEVSDQQAQEMWELYSDRYAAGWLSMSGYSDEELWERLDPYWRAG